MTPLQIFEYKNNWMASGGVGVRMHSDLDTEAKTWCRENLQQHQWLMRSWSSLYEHTFWFETAECAVKFTDRFSEWAVND
jgi:hypothetical protein